MAILETMDVFKQSLSKADGLHRITEDELVQLQRELLGMLRDIDEVCRDLEIPYMLGGGNALGAVRHQGFIPWDDDVDINVSADRVQDLVEELGTRYPDKYYFKMPTRTPGYFSTFTEILKKGTVFREYISGTSGEEGIKIDVFPIEATYDDPIRRFIHGVLCDAVSLHLSCVRMHWMREEFLRLAGENRKASAVIKFKAFVGHFLIGKAKPVDGRAERLFRRAVNIHHMCRNNNSRYISMPTGRKHFFGELYERDKFLKTTYMPFEDATFAVTEDYKNYMSKLYGEDYMTPPPEDKRERHMIYELKL